MVIQDTWTGNDAIAGGNGRDTVDYSKLIPPGYDIIYLVANLFSHSISKFIYGVCGGIDSISSVEKIIGSRGSDSISGGDVAITLHGNDGNDTLGGSSSGDDWLDGGAGSDSLIGYAGRDSLNGLDGNDVSIA